LIAVNFLNPTRKARLWFSIAFVTLALSVFIWGLGYKLSLYAPPQSESHLIPKAKLLSKNERNVREKVPLIDDSRPPSPVAQRVLPWLVMLSFAALLLKTPTLSLWELDAARSWHLRRLPCLNSFFSRPPPILG
jgi:hypothetical protein